MKAGSPSKSRVVLRGTASSSVLQAVRECMEACRWEELVPRGAVVVVKPNICATAPEQLEMSNTDLAVTEAVCEVLLTRTGRIFIGESDHLRRTALQAFEAAGYASLPRKYGVHLVSFTESPLVPVPCGPAGTIALPRMLLEADAFLTLPVLKTHALTYFTGSLKNQWGCVPQHDRILLHRYIDELLVVLHRVFRPALSIMDAIVGMEGRGPVNGKPRRLNLLLAGRDSVALDAAAMRLVGLDPQKARHVAMAAAEGLGRIDPDAIELLGDWDRYATQFEPPVLDAAVAAMNYMTRYRWFVRYALERDSVFYPARAFVQTLRRLHLVRS